MLDVHAADFGARLGAVRDLQSVFAFQRRDADFRAQRRLRKRDRNHAVQIVALALKERVLLHMQDDVKITRRSAVQAAFSESGVANAGPVFHACWNFRVYRPLPQHPALAFALGAGIGNHAAGALAGGTGAGNAEEALLVANLSAAIAGTAGDRRLCPRPHPNRGTLRSFHGGAP